MKYGGDVTRLLERLPSMQEAPGSEPQHPLNLAWHTPVILALKRWSQEDQKFKLCWL